MCDRACNRMEPAAVGLSLTLTLPPTLPLTLAAGLCHLPGRRPHLVQGCRERSRGRLVRGL
eukprot:scaffold122940_cov48-Phaeocystis_antarctica.AAC.2